MPRKTKEEIIADLEAKLEAARISVDKSKQSKIDKLKAEVATLDERAAKLATTKQGKLDEIALLERELTEADTADAHVGVNA